MQWTRVADNSPGWREYHVTGLHPMETTHVVIIPEDAFNGRIVLYGLTTEDDALTHIMWEHHVRLNPTMPDAVLPAAVKANFDRMWGPGHKPVRGLQMTTVEIADIMARHNQAYSKARPPKASPRIAGITPKEG